MILQWPYDIVPCKPVYNRTQSLNNIPGRLFTFFIILLLSHNFNLLEIVSAQVGQDPAQLFYPNVEECGMTNEIAGDVRTTIPWIVAIYLKKTPQSKFEYFLTGSLITSTTVLTIFGGGYGYPLHKNKKKRYRIPSPSRYLVVAGLPSTGLDDADNFTQYANVSYVAPFTENSSENRDYHLVIFRLETPFSFKTPYVRPICIPFAILPFLRSIGFEGKFSEIITFREEASFLGGFNRPLEQRGSHQPQLLPSKLSADEMCFNTYKFHYRSLPDDVFCAKVEPGDGIGNSTCLTHGSSSAWKSSPYVISFIPALGPPRWIFNGPVGLVPKKDRGHCNVNSTYFIAMVYNENDWIRRHMICDPNTFPCSSGKCIPLFKLCDGKIDCEDENDGADEDPIYCSATNRCSLSDKYYQCGFQGKCINISQVGDGQVDCPHENDEDPRLISALNHIITAAKCFPVNVGEGVAVEYSNANGKVNDSELVVGTEAILSCDKFYTPTHRTNFIKMTCYDNKKWKPFVFFSCQPECGLDSNSGAPGFRRNKSPTFPWHASIFKENASGTVEFICGASLIERNVLLTAAHCLYDTTGEKASPEKFRIVLGLESAIKNYPEIQDFSNAQIFQVEEIWCSWLFDLDTKQSDIAVIKISKSVVYNQYIRPICYLLRNFKQFPFVGSTGYAVGYTEENETTYSELEVTTSEKCDPEGFGKFCAKTSFLEPDTPSLDGGEGIVFSTDDDGSSKYVLKGIFSDTTKYAERSLEEGSKINGFTHVDSYSEWLLSILESIDTNPAA